MLDDHSRKILRILYNFGSLNGRPPTIDELVHKSSRTPGCVNMSLRILALEDYIRWHPERHDETVVMRGWERNPKNWWESSDGGSFDETFRAP